MSNFDAELRDRLASLAAAMPTPDNDLIEKARRCAHDRRSNRLSALAAVGGVIATAAIVIPIAIIHNDGSGPGAEPKTPLTSAIPNRPSPASTDKELRVGAPPIVGISVPFFPDQPLCSSGSLHAVARSATTADGVVGAVTVTGDACSLGTTGLRVTGILVGSQPVPLIHSTGTDRINPPAGVIRNSGSGPRVPATIGFAWHGSWCGAPATAVRLDLGKGREHNKHGREVGPIRHLGSLTVPLAGPSPACHTRSDGVLIPGVVSGAHQPAQTPPDSWRGLRLSLRVAPTSNGHVITSIDASVHNITSTPIVLSPCATYLMMIRSHVGGLAGRPRRSPGYEIDGAAGPFGCRPTPAVVPPHGVVDFSLPNAHHARGEIMPAGTVISIQLTIAGVPTATAHTTVR